MSQGPLRNTPGRTEPDSRESIRILSTRRTPPVSTHKLPVDLKLPSTCQPGFVPVWCCPERDPPSHSVVSLPHHRDTIVSLSSASPTQGSFYALNERDCQDELASDFLGCSRARTTGGSCCRGSGVLECPVQDSNLRPAD